MRKTKIVATFGPAVDDETLARSVIAAGVDVVRLNFSHGSRENHARRAELIRRIEKDIEKPIALMVDLQGPKIRTGKIAEGTVTLKKDDTFILTSKKVKGTSKRVSTNYPELSNEVSVGDAILIDDGKIRLLVLETNETEVITRIVDGGILSDRKAINLPGAKISAPSMTDKDEEDLQFSLDTFNPEFVALSFVRTGADVRILRQRLRTAGSDAGIIAKIEKPEAVEHFGEIAASLDLGDGIMVARGDLGVEVDFYKVPAIQKDLLNRANKRGLLTITATQMLDSMMREPMPTRAESTDVFNAILDGSDALMLSGETAAGSYPMESVKAMAAIICEAEAAEKEGESHQLEPTFCDTSFELGTARAACTAAETVGARGIVAMTRSGRTALLMSKLTLPRRIPFYALTVEKRSWRRMALYRGVKPLLMSGAFDPRDAGVWDMVDEALLQKTDLKKQDTVVLASGYNTVPGTTNVCKIVRLGNREYY